MDYSITAYLGPRAIFEGLRKDKNSKLGYSDKIKNRDMHVCNPACITVGVNQIGSTATGYPPKMAIFDRFCHFSGPFRAKETLFQKN